MAYTYKTNIVNKDSPVHESRGGERRGGMLIRRRGSWGEEASQRSALVSRVTIHLSNKLNSSLPQALLIQIKNLGMETVNAWLEKLLQMLLNDSKESTSSPLWTYMSSLHMDMKKMKFIKSP